MLCPTVIEPVPNVFDTISKLNQPTEITGFPVSHYFKDIDAYDDGRTIQPPGHSVVLWTGPNGREKAEQMQMRGPHGAMWYMFNRPAAFYTDTAIPALTESFKLINEDTTLSPEWKTYLNNLN